MQALRATRALRPPQKRFRLAGLQPPYTIKANAPSGADAAPTAEAKEQKTLQSELPDPRESREKAEAGFTLANAVRVAGPDRILFLW